jgi:hypothetical protein
MDTTGLLLMAVGLTVLTASKLRAAYVMLNAEPERGLLVLFPPYSVVALFQHWDRLWLPTVIGTSSGIMFFWGLVLVL